MTKQINLIELLSLFSPCDNFSKDFNVEVLDQHAPHFTKNFCELVREYLKLQKDSTALKNSLYTSIVNDLYLDSESGDLQIRIDSYIHKNSTTTKFITFNALTYVLEPTSNALINVWNLKENLISKIKHECVFDALTGPFNSWPSLGEDMLVLSLTITKDPNDFYKLVIYCAACYSETRLNALACADYDEECK